MNRVNISYLLSGMMNDWVGVLSTCTGYSSTRFCIGRLNLMQCLMKSRNQLKTRYAYTFGWGEGWSEWWVGA